MLNNYDKSIMIWTPAYFEERGWAQIEKNTIMQKRVSEGKRFVPILLKGDSKIIPSIFKDYVIADFRDYEKNRDPQLFIKKMEDVVKGLKKNN